LRSTALNITIPYEETEPKQLMVENIAITNNDKEEQNITKSKTTESVKVPPHSHTTQATNATTANANRQEAKTKQKRTKKKDQLDFESVEMQLAD
jgi:microcystin-dependent protein